MPRGQTSAYLSQNTFTNKIPKVEIIDLDKALKGVSRDYHLVTYTEVQNKGKVTQKFVNEQGAEVRPSVTSEVKAVGEQITLTHPTDIDFENKRYTFKEQDKQDITEIVKGETVITYVYKQKYENNLPPIETETPIPIETTYVEDPTMEVGDNETVENGTVGKIVTLTPKIVNELTGEVIDGQPTEKRTEMQPKVIKVGTKPKVVETTIPYTTRYVEDNTKDKDYREVTRPGKVGKTTTTTTYVLDPKTGAVTPNEPKKIVEQPVEEVITVGTKQKVEVPKVEVPKVEVPKVEAPKVEAPIAQSTKETSQIPTSVASKREKLPNTGTEDHANLEVLGLLGILSGFGFLVHKKKKWRNSFSNLY